MLHNSYIKLQEFPHMGGWPDCSAHLCLLVIKSTTLCFHINEFIILSTPEKKKEKKN